MREQLTKHRWSRPGIPQRGWECVDITDLGEPCHKCQMCGNEEVRYVHTMAHLDHTDLRVGCVCACKMAAGYNGRETERAVRNRAKRRETFCDAARGWKRSAKGNSYRERDDRLIVVGKFAYGGFWACVDGQYVAGQFLDFRSAAGAAFDMIDPPESVAAGRRQ